MLAATLAAAGSAPTRDSPRDVVNGESIRSRTVITSVPSVLQSGTLPACVGSANGPYGSGSSAACRVLNELRNVDCPSPRRMLGGSEPRDSLNVPVVLRPESSGVDEPCVAPSKATFPVRSDSWRPWIFLGQLITRRSDESLRYEPRSSGRGINN